MKRRILIIILIVLAVEIVFGAIIISVFYGIRNNTIDNVAMPYLWQSEEIGEQIGEIVHIGRKVEFNSTKSETERVVPYYIETSNKRYLVEVTLQKVANEWQVVDYTFIEEYEADGS